MSHEETSEGASRGGWSPAGARAAAVAAVALALAAAPGLASTPLDEESQTWAREEKLAPRGVGLDDDFGHSVAVDGDRAAVGAPDGEAGSIQDAGAVYVYERAGDGWTRAAKVVAATPQPHAAFGWTVVLDGDRLAVGEPSRSADGNRHAGAVHVFERTDQGWRQQARLGVGDGLGGSLSLEGSTLVAGAPTRDAGAAFAGAVFVFRPASGGWQQTAQLVPEDTEFNARFGASVATTGERVLVGTPDPRDRGRAYVFDRSSEVWEQTARLTVGEPGETSDLGAAVELGPGTATVADPGRAVYAFESTPSGWNQAQELAPSSRSQGDGFGGSLALDGDRLLVGAPAGDGPAVPDTGAVHVYARPGGQWTQMDRFAPADGRPFDDFGEAVGLAGERALVGAPGQDRVSGAQAGAAYALAPCPRGPPSGDTLARPTCTTAVGLP